MTSEYDRKQQARGKRGGSRTAGQGRGENPFVNVTLTSEQEAAKREWISDYAQLIDYLQEEVDNGYTITIKYDEYSSAYAVFLRPAPGNPDNDGLVLAGRGGSAGSALRDALFIHREALGREWYRGKSINGKDYSDDTF